MRLRRASAACFVVVATLVLPTTAGAQLVIGPGLGGTEVHLIEATGTRTFQPFYPAFVDGMSVTLGDINGDGVVDVIAGAGPGGGPHVRAFSGTDLSELASFYAFDPSFAGGVTVAAGDVDGDGRSDIIVGAGRGGGPHVRVFSGLDGSEIASFYAFDPAFQGGVHVAAGDVNGDGRVDIVTGAGAGGAPHVRVFSGLDLSEVASFYAYDPAFTGGVSVAAGDINGDGVSDLITGAGPGGGPHVAVFSGLDLSVLASFYAFDPAFPGGVGVAAGDVNGDNRVDLILGAGPGGGPHVRILSGIDLSELASFYATGTGAGVSVGSTGDAAGLRFTSPRTTSFLAGTPGTFTATTAGTPVPALTVSGALPAGVTWVDHGDGTATLGGTPGAGTGGEYLLTFTATNGVGTPVTQSFTLTVTQAPAMTSADATTFNVGLAGSFTVTTTGFPLPAIGQSGASLPAGIAFVDNGDGTGTLSGTAASGTGGSYALGFTANNGIGAPAVQAFTLTVSDGPAITSANATTFTVGSAGTFTVTTVATPTATLTLTGPLPAGVTFVDNLNGTGTMSGTPAAGTGGAHAVTFTAANGTLPNGSQAFTLTVNEAPAITSATGATFTAGVAGSFTVTTTGFPAPALTRDGVALPAGVTFVDNGNGTGTLAGAPAPATGGVYSLQFTATNVAGATAPQTFTLTVHQAPVLTGGFSFAFSVGVAGTFTIAATGFPPPTLTHTGGTMPNGLTFVDNGNGTGTLSGTPASGTAGVHALTITVSNGVGAPLVNTFTVPITEGPVITSASSATFALGALNTFTVTAGGFPFPSLVQGGAALPSGVTWVDNGDGTGTLSGTPAAGTGGDYALTFTATNGSGSAVQNFTLTVAGSPGFTSAPTTTFTVGTPGTYTVTTVGAPPPAIAFSGTLPAVVTFLDNGGGSGTLSGTPAAGTGGTYALTLTAANGVLPDGTQAFTLNVNEGPTITSANATTFTVGSAGSFNVAMTGFPAPTVSVTAGTLPAGVTLTPAGLLSGTPDTGTGGTYNVTLTATNGIGADAVQAFTLTINEPPIITSVNTATFVLNTAGTTFQVVMTGIPAPTVSVTSGVLPTGLTLSAAGLLSGTPTQSGSFPVTLTATNGTLPNATQAFTVLVNAAPAITSANATTFTVGSAGSFNAVMTGFPTPTVSVTAGTLPAGVTLSPAGVLSGTPDPGTGGAHNVTFTATNGIGANAVQSFTLTVNQAPAITSANTAPFLLNTAGATFQVVMTGFPAPTVSVTTGTLPTGLTLSSAGLLSGTPTQGGSFPVTLTATNGTLPNATQSFTVAVNAPPAITSANNATFTVGTPSTFTVTTTGFPAPTVSQTGPPPAGITFTPATRVLGGTATQTGAFPLQFTGTNAVVPDAVQNFTLNVVCPAITVTPLVLPDGLYQTAYGAVDFNQTGSTGSIFTWGATGLPAGLTIDIGTGVVSGTPTNTVLNGAVVVTVTDNFGCTGSVITTLTIRPVADADAFTGGVGNTQFVVGAAAPLTPHVFVADTVLNGDQGPAPLTASLSVAPANGGVSLAANGTFVYTPNAGFAGSSDTFTYTLTDGNGVTNTATVTINLSGMVWYVNSSGANGDGRSHSPFNVLNNAAAPSLTNQSIYVHSGGATTPGNIALDANQTLHGAGATFSLNGLTILAGTRPTLTGTVTLGNNTAVTAVNFTPSAIPAMVASGLTQAVAIDQVNVTGGTNALSMLNVSGAVTVTNATFTNTTGAEVLISQGTGNVSIAAAISSNAGRSIDIQNRTGGTVTFTGAITDTGLGVFLNANTGSTINFTGGLALSTTTSPGFTATGDGTVSATQNNTTIVNTITTTTGTALNVANTTIGAGGLTFRSISANGPAKGIILNTTGSGAFTVTGTGPAGSGGTIQNATSRGGEFISVNSVTLNDMNFTNNGTAPAGIVNTLCADALNQSTTPVATVQGLNCEANIYLLQTTSVTLSDVTATLSNGIGILGNSVSGLTLTNVQATSNGDEVLEDGVQLVNQAGTVTVTGGIYRDNASRSFEIQKNSGAAATLNISGATFGNTTSPTGVTMPSTATAGDTILVATNGTNSVSLTTVITGSTFSNIFGRAINSNTEGNTTQNVTFGQAGAGNGNTVSNVSYGTDVNGTTSGSVTYSIVNNTFNNTPGTVTSGARTVINSRKGFGATGSWTGVISGNTVGTAAVVQSGCDTVTCGGISADNAATAGSHDITITNNLVRRVNGHGIFVANNPGTTATGTVRARIEGNTLTDPDDGTAGAGGNQGSGVIVTTTGAGAILNVKAGGSGGQVNTVTGNWGTQSAGTIRGVRFTRGGSTTFCISGYSGPFDSTSVGNFITTQNAGNAGSATQSLLDAPATFSGPSCPVP